jgi:L-ascorbate metabolism protein UlaG (beta-lactamase superfamily)
MALDRDTTFTWYGHSAFEVRTPGGRKIILDPFFANPKSPATADSIQRCDLLLVSHGHFDHMGDAIALASRLRPSWPCMPRGAERLHRGGRERLPLLLRR